MNVRTRLTVIFGVLVLGSGVAATVGTAAALALPTCAGLPVTIIAQPGAVTLGDGGGVPTDDVILGTSGPDVIDGLQGNDTICGLEGDDTIDGGIGSDRILGQEGDDTIAAGPGADTVFAGNGNDNVDAGPGADTVEGGDGDDNVVGGDGDDTVLGEGGDDDMLGGDGVDLLDGGDHNLGDRANGGAGVDSCPNDETVINC